ncbi:hypothetical protein SNE40_021483 [Patella caerulea]|uniref:EF-hand domain-containing protein n=1 Tax=Patella caerulea TaxID=87958 RepID=A0AAN8IWQ7_PATCE
MDASETESKTINGEQSTEQTMENSEQQAAEPSTENGEQSTEQTEKTPAEPTDEIPDAAPTEENTVQTEGENNETVETTEVTDEQAEVPETTEVTEEKTETTEEQTEVTDETAEVTEETTETGEDQTEVTEPQTETTEEQTTEAEPEVNGETEEVKQEEEEPTEPPAEEETTQETEVEAEQEEVVANGDEAPADLNLSEEQVEKLRKTFEIYANDDQVDYRGFKKLIRCFGQNPVDDELRLMYETADKNSDGNICFNEFCRLVLAHRQPDEVIKEEILNCLDRIFPEEQHEIELTKVIQIMSKLDRQASDLSQSDVIRFCEEMDINQNGKIDRAEFVSSLCGSGISL